jgi:hypothetical protein
METWFHQVSHNIPRYTQEIRSIIANASARATRRSAQIDETR